MMRLTFVLICSCDYFQLVLIVRHLIERWSILVIIAGVLNFKMATSYFFSDTKEEINMIKKIQFQSVLLIQKMLILSMELLLSKQTLRYQVFAYLINPSPPEIWLSILPSSYNTSPCKIDYVNLVFNQGNKLYLMSWSILTTCLLLWCMDAIRRSYMLITFGS